MPRVNVVLPVPMLPDRAIYKPGSITDAKRLPSCNVAASSDKKTERIPLAELFIEGRGLCACYARCLRFVRRPPRTRVVRASRRQAAMQDELLSGDCRFAVFYKQLQCAGDW